MLVCFYLSLYMYVYAHTHPKSLTFSLHTNTLSRTVLTSTVILAEYNGRRNSGRSMLVTHRWFLRLLPQGIKRLISQRFCIKMKKRSLDTILFPRKLFFEGSLCFKLKPGRLDVKRCTYIFLVCIFT